MMDLVDPEFRRRFEDAKKWLLPAMVAAWKAENKWRPRHRDPKRILEKIAREISAHDAYTVDGVAERRRSRVEKWIRYYPRLALMGILPPMHESDKITKPEGRR